MYVCICKAVSEKRLQQAVDSGEVLSLRDLSRVLGVGTGCGKCVPGARQALCKALSVRALQAPPAAVERLRQAPAEPLTARAA